MSGPMQFRGGRLVPAIVGPSGDGIQPATVAPPEKDDHDDDEDDGQQDSGPAFAAPIYEAQVAQVAHREAARPPKRAAPSAPVNVVKLARARLRAVEAELRHMKRLQAERDELRRLLEAAKSKPRSNVRELPKRSAG